MLVPRSVHDQEAPESERTPQTDAIYRPSPPCQILPMRSGHLSNHRVVIIDPGDRCSYPCHRDGIAPAQHEHEQQAGKSRWHIIITLSLLPTRGEPVLFRWQRRLDESYLRNDTSQLKIMYPWPELASRAPWPANPVHPQRLQDVRIPACRSTC